MVDGVKSGDPSLFQIEADIMHMDAPLSMIHRETWALRILTGIWKATAVGARGQRDAKGHRRQHSEPM